MGGTQLMSRWLGPIGILAGPAAVLLSIHAGWPAVIGVMAAALIGAWWISPLRNPGGVAHAEAAHAAASDGAVVIYWRPGCPFCSRLRRRLGAARRGRVLWVNIWADADAAAFVRSVNDGNETVPTVVVGSEHVWTNPAPDRVRTIVDDRANETGPIIPQTPDATHQPSPTGDTQGHAPNN